MESEHRLLSFAGGPERAERLPSVQEQIRAERQRRIEAAGNASDKINPRTIDASEVDEDRAQRARETQRRMYLMEDIPESRRYDGARRKCEMLEKIFADEMEGGRGRLRKVVMEGVKYGTDGKDFTIVAADELFVEFAMNRITGQIKVLQEPSEDPATEHAFNRNRDTEQTYNDRMQKLRNDKQQYAANLRRNNDAQITEWTMVFVALERYKASTDGYRKFAQAVEANPKLILSAPDAIKRDNPRGFKQLLRNAVAADPSVLQNVDVNAAKPAGMSSREFVQVLGEAIAGDKETGRKPSPLLLQYLPDAEKERDGGAPYRAKMIEAAKVNGSVLGVAAKEYAKYWQNVDESGYADLCVNALNQNPRLIILNFDYLHPESIQTFRSIIDRLAPKTKLEFLRIIEIFDRYFGKLEGGYAGFIESQLSGPMRDQVLIVVAKNEYLWEKIQAEDPKLHRRLCTMVQGSDDPNVRDLLRLPHIAENEKIGVNVLRNLVDLVDQVDALDPESSNFDQLLRERGKELSALPRVMWEDKKHQNKFLSIFSAQGELMRFAPSYVQDNKPFVMNVLRANAGAYAHVSERLQNDSEVLYRALKSDQQENGEFFWKHVGRDLKVQLKLEEIKGIPTSAEFLRRIELGLPKKKVETTSSTVDSLLDHLEDAQKNDPELVKAYLLKYPDHPEYILDAGDDLLSDIDFISSIVERMPKVFAYIDHEALYRGNPDAYVKLAASIQRKEPGLYYKIPDPIRTNKSFATEVKKALRSMPASKPL